MAADGSIVIVADVDDKKAQAELNSLAKKIDSLNAKIKQAQDARFPLVERAEELGVQLDIAKAKLQEMQAAAQGTYTADQIADQKETVKSLQVQWNAVQSQVERYDRSIAKATGDIEIAETRAGELAANLSGAGKSGAQAGGEISDAMNHAASRIEKLGKRILGLAKRVFIFSVITSGLRSMRAGLVNAIKANNDAATAIGNLKGALLTLAQPILNVVIPAITALARALTTVVSAVASFISALTGTALSDSADAAEDLANGLNATAAAGAKASKQFARFDEISRLSESGGGGGGATSDAITPLFDAIKDFELPDWLKELTTDLKLRFEDVFLDWEDLTPEKIAEKILTGVLGLSGAIIGFELAGPQGALVGTIFGVILGLAMSDAIYNFDGTLSADEVVKSILTGASAIGGLVLSSLAGGGILGLTIPATLALGVSHIVTNWDNIAEGWEDIIRGDFESAVLTSLNQKGPLVDIAEGIVNAIFGKDTWDTAKKYLEEGGTIANASELVKENIFDPFIGAIKSLFGISESEYDSSVTHSIGSYIIHGFVKGIYETDLWKWVKENIYDRFITPLLSYFGIGNNASSEMEKHGAAVIFGFVKGIYDTDLWKWVKENIYDRFITPLKSYFGIANGSSSEMNGYGDSVIYGFLHGINATDLWKWVKTNIYERFANAVNSLFGIGDEEPELFKIGKKIINTFLTGIQSAWKSIVSWVETAIEDLLGLFNINVNLSSTQSTFGSRGGFGGKIPELATGAVIPPNREFLAVLGDQKSGTNIEAPLDTIVAAFRQVMSEQGNGGNRTIVLQLDRRELGRAVVDVYDLESQRVGLQLGGA